MLGGVRAIDLARRVAAVGGDAGGVRVPALRAVRAQRRRRARPGRLRRPAARHPRPLRPQRRRRPAARVAHDDRRAAHRGARCPSTATAATGSASPPSGPRRGRLFSVGTGAAVTVGMLVAMRIGAGGGPGRRHAHPLVAALRLLRAGGAGEGVLRPPAGELGGPDPRAADRRRARAPLRLPGAVLRVRHTHPDLRRARPAAPRAGARRTTSARRQAPTRRRPRCADAPETRLVDHAGARTGSARSGGSGWPCRSSPSPCSASRRCCPSSTRTCSASTAPPRGAIAAGVEPLQVDRCVRRHAPGRQGRDDGPRVPAALRRHRRRVRRAAARGPRLRPQRGIAVGHARPARRVHRHAGARLLRPACRSWRHPGCGPRRSRPSRCSPSPASPSSCPSSAWCPTRWASRPAWWCWCPIAVVASFILASASKFVVDDITAAHADVLTRADLVEAPADLEYDGLT